MTASERIQKRNERMHAMFERGRELKKLQLFDEMVSTLEIIAAWDPAAASSEEGGMSIMDAIDIAKAALAKANAW